MIDLCQHLLLKTYVNLPYVVCKSLETKNEGGGGSEQIKIVKSSRPISFRDIADAIPPPPLSELKLPILF